MIGSLRGRLLDKDPAGELLIEVGGVGYRTTVGPSALAASGPVGQECFVYVHHRVREDSADLYGFPTLDERRCFEALLSAHGVGPALALAVLSHLPPDELRRAVAVDDAAVLEVVPGIGAKTSKRMVLDLKSKLGVPESVGAEGAAGPSGDGTGTAAAEVRAALGQMGFSPAEVREAMAAVVVAAAGEDAADPGALLRVALQELGPR
ncbi:Holliday junction branch migration protein RuvA [Candidatus Poriferisodalis sp.]|uniref:Holliday junction branch migration protein RuvA n=1 Tax=Candidatus Poriferisodalis sp. TaxID=3101277 RepID=UPI003B016FD4